MTFEQALTAMREGKRVRLRNRMSVYGVKDGQLYSIFRCRICRGNLTSEEIMRDDWEVVE